MAPPVACPLFARCWSWRRPQAVAEMKGQGQSGQQRDVNTYQDATLIMQLLRDNLEHWQSADGHLSASTSKRLQTIRTREEQAEAMQNPGLNWNL